MTMSFNVKAQSAFKKLGAVALITATLAVFFTACKQTGGGGGKPKHAINFSVDRTTPNGTLKAEGDGITQPATSPITVEEGKTVTFTATASSGYRVKGWTLDGSPITEAGTNTEYKLKVSKPATVSVSFEVASVEGGAVLILSPDKLTIKVKAITEDGSAITVEGCNETTLENGKYTELHAKVTVVILKGKITKLSCSGENNNKGSLTSLNVQGLTSLRELSCGNNKLTELNVQGCTSLRVLWCYKNQLTSLNVQGLTSLQELNCWGNQLTELNVQGLTSLQSLGCGSNKLSELNVQGLTSLQRLSCSGNKLTELNVQGCASLQELYCKSNKLNAQAMTKLLNALPAREASDNAEANLYTEKTDVTEGNCKDYSQPAELKAAFDGAKNRNWKLQKYNASEDWVDI